MKLTKRYLQQIINILYTVWLEYYKMGQKEF